MELSDDLPAVPGDGPVPMTPEPGGASPVTTRPALPYLDDAARSPNPAVCPFFRFDLEGDLVAPLPKPDDGNRCAALGSPRPQSTRQQELVCLTQAHADCPRYLRGAMALQEPAEARQSSGIPRATVAALLILVLSAGISFGFVVQRGGIDLPVLAAAPASTALALAESPSPSDAEGSVAPSVEPGGGVEVPSAVDSPVPSPVASAPPSADPSPSLAPSPSPSPSPSAPASSSPALTPSPAVGSSATPRATPRPTKKPTSDRYALLKPCPDRDNCYVYVVRSGDNLYSIAHYFGISLSKIYAWNPQYPATHLRVGAQIRMPPPTR